MVKIIKTILYANKGEVIWIICESLKDARLKFNDVVIELQKQNFDFVVNLTSCEIIGNEVIVRFLNGNDIDRIPSKGECNYIFFETWLPPDKHNSILLLCKPNKPCNQ